MRFRLFMLFTYVLCFCWFEGMHLGAAKTAELKTEQERPYRVIMDEAVEGLREMNVKVMAPKDLPVIITCGECLQKREAFGAFTATADQVVVPENFDVTSLEGRAVLIHEYGHFLLTEAGVPSSEQERLCLSLGNSIYQRFFTADVAPTENND